MAEDKGTVCVTGATGYIASWLIMRLLQQGYKVRATIRSHHITEKKDLTYLTSLPEASTRLQIYHADLDKTEGFVEAIHGCVGVFHLAHPMDVQGQELEETVTKRAMEGTLGILKACLESKTVKRVVYTSSAATILFNKGLGQNNVQDVVDEDVWSDLGVCRSNSLVSSSYTVSKMLTEKAALEFGKENGLEVVSLVLPLVVGPFICPNIPSSVYIALAMILGNESLYEYLTNSYMVHIDDATRALIFLLECENVDGRYICSSNQISFSQMYEFLHQRYPEFPITMPRDMDQHWKQLWQLEVPERVKSFGWQLLHGKIPTKMYCSKWRPTDLDCHVCVGNRETILHVLRDCSHAKFMWNHLLDQHDRTLFYNCDFNTWIARNTGWGAAQYVNKKWCYTWITGCYYLWFWRNREVHDEDYTRPFQPHKVVLQNLDYYNTSMRYRGVSENNIRNQVLVKWLPPPADWMSLDVDGASKQGRKKAGCGGVIRDQHGTWLGGFAKFVGDANAFTAEAWAVYEGLMIAKDKGCRQVQLRLDSLTLVLWLRTFQSLVQSTSGLLRRIAVLLQLDWKVEVIHVYREANRVADGLANIGCGLHDRVVVYDSVPSQLEHILADDLMGVATPRLIHV